MPIAQRLRAAAAVLLLLSTAGARAELPVRDILSITPAGDLFAVWDYYTGVPDYFTNYNNCIAI